MTKRADPIGDPLFSGTDRLNYAEGMMLDATDFADEQLYHRARLARSLKYLFGTGTAAGLEVVPHAAGRELMIKPGLAIDPVGRLIELRTPVCVNLAEWFAFYQKYALDRGRDFLTESWINETVAGAPADAPIHVNKGAVVVADVFIRFVAAGHAKTPAFATGPYDALDAVVDERIRDGFEVALVPRSEAGIRRANLAELPPPPNPQVIPVPDQRAILLGLNTNPAARLTQIQALVLNAWRDGTEASSARGPSPLVEHVAADLVADETNPRAVAQDTRSVLLARMVIPVAIVDDKPVPPDTSVTPRALVPILPTHIDNSLRRFIYDSGFHTRPVGA